MCKRSLTPRSRRTSGWSQALRYRVSDLQLPTIVTKGTLAYAVIAHSWGPRSDMGDQRESLIGQQCINPNVIECSAGSDVACVLSGVYTSSSY